MLLKGLQDVNSAPDAREAADMVLLRLIHAADMPDPASLISQLSSGVSGSGLVQGTQVPQVPPLDCRAIFELLLHFSKTIKNRSLPNNFTIMFVWPAIIRRSSS